MLRSNSKKILTLICIVFLCIALSVPAFAATEIPAPTPDFYVNDFAGILSQETHDTIMSLGPALADQTGAQVVVVTMNTLNGDDLLKFATDMYRSYGIGDKEHNRGLLMLIVKEDRDFKIEVGYGLEGVLNDAKLGRLTDSYIIPYLKNDQWDEGVINGYNAILEELKVEFSAELDNAKPFEYEEPSFIESFFSDWSGYALSAAPISLIIALILTKRREKGKMSKKAANRCIGGWLLALTIGFLIAFGFWVTLFMLFCSGIAALLGAAAAQPGGSYGTSSSYGSNTHRSSSSSGSSGYSGGGGSSGGGGISRKF